MSDRQVLRGLAGDPHQLGTASVVQASGIRSDVTLFRLNAAAEDQSG